MADTKQTAHTPTPCSDHYDCSECSAHLDQCLENQAARFKQSHDKLVEALEAITENENHCGCEFDADGYRDKDYATPCTKCVAEAALRAAKGE